MSSKIEQQIDQIEDFIDSCRYQKFSKTNIIVDKDELDGLLANLILQNRIRLFPILDLIQHHIP